MEKTHYQRFHGYLTGTNYLVWAMKMEMILTISRRKIEMAIKECMPEERAEHTIKSERETRNQEAVAYIRLHLSDEQALHFVAENNAKVLWSKTKSTYIGAAEDYKIEESNDLRFLRMEDKLLYYTVRARNNKFKNIREILKP